MDNLLHQLIGSFFAYGMVTGLFIACTIAFINFAITSYIWRKRAYSTRLFIYSMISMIGYALFSVYAVTTHFPIFSQIIPNWLLFLGKVTMPVALFLNSKVFFQSIPIQSMNAFIFWNKSKTFFIIIDLIYLITFIIVLLATDPRTVVAISMGLTVITSITGLIFAHNALKSLGRLYTLMLIALIIAQSLIVILFLSIDSTELNNRFFVIAHLSVGLLVSTCAFIFAGYINHSHNIANSLSAIENAEALYKDILHALNHDGLYLEYQPQINISNGKICGLEALIRLNHPLKGSVSPDSFIPLAEQSELINYICKWLIKQVTQDQKLLSQYGKQIPISINFSVKNITPEMITYLIEHLTYQNINMNLITIEITESLFLDMNDSQKQAIEMIKNSKFNLSLDDFSAGFSSLLHLDELELHELKIDKLLTARILEPNKKTVVSMIVNMCHELDINVVAEGVENDDVLQILSDIHCQVAQGYGICRPLKMNDLLVWLINKKTCLR